MRARQIIDETFASNKLEASPQIERDSVDPMHEYVGTGYRTHRTLAMRALFRGVVSRDGPPSAGRLPPAFAASTAMSKTLR
jgi:hypothetical protein